MDTEQSQQMLDELEPKVERLKALYQQYFLGIEKIPPGVLRKDVDRTIWTLRRTRLPNTRLRFKFQQIIQRYNTYNQYWTRILREIDNGTYKRDLVKAAQRVGVNAAMSMGGRAAQAALRAASAEAQAPGAEPQGRDPGASAADPWQQLTAEQQAYYAQYGYDAASYRAYYQQTYAPQTYDPQTYAPQTYDPQTYDPQAYTPQAYDHPGHDPGQAYLLPDDASPGGSPEPASPEPTSPEPEPPARGRAQPPPPPRRRQAAEEPAEEPKATTVPRRGGALFGARAGKAAAKAPPAEASATPQDGPTPQQAAPAPTPPRRPPPPPRRAPPPPRTGEAAEDARTKQLYDEYVRARRAAGSASDVSYDQLATSLADQKKKLLDKHGANRKIDFEVVTKDGRALIRPVIK